MKQALLLAVLGYLQVLVQSQPMQEGFVEVPGTRIHYKDSGGHGVPVIFLHANTGTADAWEKQIPAFTGKPQRQPRSFAIGLPSSTRLGVAIHVLSTSMPRAKSSANSIT